MILTAIEKGVNFFDTAYIYQGSEELLGKTLAKHGLREKVFIATKMPMILCKDCRKCEPLCPQKISIAKSLKDVVKKMETPIFKMMSFFMKKFAKKK